MSVSFSRLVQGTRVRKLAPAYIKYRILVLGHISVLHCVNLTTNFREKRNSNSVCVCVFVLESFFEDIIWWFVFGSLVPSHASANMVIVRKPCGTTALPLWQTHSPCFVINDIYPSLVFLLAIRHTATHAEYQMLFSGPNNRVSPHVSPHLSPIETAT